MSVTPRVSFRSLRAVANAPRQPHAPGFNVAFLHPHQIDGGMDPFLQIDAFALAEPVFAPHPHAGFNAVTYILPESPIGFINRDSLGSRNIIAPGGLHWTMAGRGVMHEEIPEQRGTAVLGLQIFVNLPVAKKHFAPAIFHLSAEDVPVVAIGGATIRAVIGQSNGLASPLNPPTPGVRLIDVTLAPGAEFQQELEDAENCFIWIISGAARNEGGSRETDLAAFDLAGFESGGTAVKFRGGPNGARLVLFSGPPLNEPIAARGPFVMSDDADLDQAFADFRAGRMGRLSKSDYDAAGHPVAPGQ